MKINIFSVNGIRVQEVSGEEGQFFSNDDVLIVIHGKPHKGQFLREGEIYQVVEPRIILVTEGDGVININLQDYHIGQGSVILTSPDVILEIKRASPDISVVALALRGGVEVPDEEVVLASPAEFGQLLRMAYLAWDIAHLTPYRKDTMHHLLRAMVSYVSYLHQPSSGRHMAGASARQQEIFQQFRQLVTRHCIQQRSIPFYAEQLCITPHHLSAVVKKASSQSVMYWINRATLQEAKLLLNRYGLMACEVADRLNFPNASAFSKFFKRETGMTPLMYQTNANG